MNLNSLVQESVFYFPVGLTSLQKELYKILIKLHKDSLLRQLNNIDLVSTKDKELNNLLMKNLKLVNNHPFLLVEHYIPNKLLLMESNERLMLQSDKFNRFDKLIQSLLNMDLKLVIVGSNVKELDLIEAFLLERDVVCTRSLNIPTIKHTDNKETTTHHRHHHHNHRARLSKDKPMLKISLITSNNLLNVAHITNNEFDLIVSFDETIDENNQNLQNFRKFDKIPLIKLVLINSFTHGMTKNQTPSPKFLFSCLSSVQLDPPIVDIVSLLTNLLRTKNWDYSLSDFNNVNDEDMTELIQSIDLEFLNEVGVNDTNESNKKIKLEVEDEEELNVSNYQNLLTKLTIIKNESIKRNFSKNSIKLNLLKEKSTVLNDSKDELKLKISELFKKAKDLKDVELFNINKLNEKLKFENDKNKESINELQKDSQNEEIKKSEDELLQILNDLKSKNEESNQQLDNLRLDYQKYTTEAGELSNSLKNLSIQNNDLLTKLKSNGIDVRHLKNDKIKLNKSQVIDKLNLELKFLTTYRARLDELVKERVSTSSVGRNGRVHRSTTPYT